jgi:hypothetical protein
LYEYLGKKHLISLVRRADNIFILSITTLLEKLPLNRIRL